jgi:hypothetical protein
VNRALIAVAATLATAAFVPAAQAATTVSFDVASSSARIEVDTTYPYTRFEVVRAGATIATSATGRLDLDDLHADDAVAIYDGATLVRSVLYDGRPGIGTGACMGRDAFLVQRSKNAVITDAGVYDEFNTTDDRSTWTTDESATVRLSRSLQPYDTAYVQTYSSDGDTTIYSNRVQRMRPCDLTIVTPPPPVAPVTPVVPVTPPELTPSSTEMLQMVRASLSVTGSSLRTRTTRRLARMDTVALPFAFPEAGRVELQLMAKNQEIASGAKTSAVNGKVILTVQLTPAARRLLKRSKKLKVTVKGAFTPVRNGAETSRASSNVTLR